MASQPDARYLANSHVTVRVPSGDGLRTVGVFPGDLIPVDAVPGDVHELLAAGMIREDTGGEVRPVYYQGAGGMQPFDVIRAFDLGFFEGNVIKYVCRAGRKTESPLEDLRKARTYLNERIRELEQG